MDSRITLTRRQFFRRTGLGLGAAALAALLNEDTVAGAPKPHFAPKAKRVIYLHMIGAPSHLDLFDPKPELVKRDGEACPESFLSGRRFAFIGGKMTLAGSPFQYARHGRSGLELSELLPNLATVADDIAVVRTLHTE